MVTFNGGDKQGNQNPAVQDYSSHMHAESEKD